MGKRRIAGIREAETSEEFGLFNLKKEQTFGMLG
jgi:hypothetical protein